MTPKKVRSPRKNPSKSTKTAPKILFPIPKVGDNVVIAIKPYKGNTATGIVARVLTKRKFHSRGHKVLLVNGKIGRVKIIQTLK